MGLEGREGGAATEAAPPGLAANGCQHQSKYLVLRPGVSGCLRLEDRGLRTDRCDLILGPKEAYHLPGGGGGKYGGGALKRGDSRASRSHLVLWAGRAVQAALEPAGDKPAVRPVPKGSKKKRSQTPLLLKI
jgi:hypothetical protein